MTVVFVENPPTLNEVFAEISLTVAAFENPKATAELRDIRLSSLISMVANLHSRAMELHRSTKETRLASHDVNVSEASVHYVHAGDEIARFIYPPTDQTSVNREVWDAAVHVAALAISNERNGEIAIVWKPWLDSLLNTRTQSSGHASPDGANNG